MSNILLLKENDWLVISVETKAKDLGKNVCFRNTNNLVTQKITRAIISNDIK